MTELKDKVSARLVENDILVCIHNVRYYDGDDMGGILYFDVECLDWLITTVSAWLEGYSKVEETNDINYWAEDREKKFSNDDLIVRTTGHDANLHISISNHRNDQVLYGGVTIESMDPEVGADLLVDLKTLREHLDQK